LHVGPEDDLPLVAIMAAATTRNVKNIKLKKLALFRVRIRVALTCTACRFSTQSLSDPSTRRAETWLAYNKQV
jgi:hypothetical protein